MRIAKWPLQIGPPQFANCNAQGAICNRLSRNGGADRGAPRPRFAADADPAEPVGDRLVGVAAIEGDHVGRARVERHEGEVGGSGRRREFDVA